MSAAKGNGRTEVMSHSDWMSQLPSKLWTIPLFKLAIPGSHDSMSYDLDINSAIVEPDSLKRFSKLRCVRHIMLKWGATQEANISNQLQAGVRYFDLRIARKPNDSNPTRLYFYHGLYTRTDVETVLREIHAWTENHPKEILILALSHFKGFDKNIEENLHKHLITFIRTLFGRKLILRSDTLTLQSCWDQGKNVIVSYDYPANQYPEIWGKITYYYGNSMDPAQIESKLCDALKKENSSQCFFVCGLNLTLPSNAKALKYILNAFSSFIKVAQRSLPKLLKWLKQQSGANIVASDLVTRDDFVSTVLELNSALV